MNQYTHRSNRSSAERAVSVIIGIMLNVLLAFIAYRTGMPMYLDTVGTISIAAVGGLFPGIMTAIITNTICTTFNSASIYFGIVNALIAMYTAWFVRNKTLLRFRNVVIYLVTVSCISGLSSSIIQWILLGEPQNPAIRSFMDSIEFGGNETKFMAFVLLNILLNLFDKGVSFGFAVLMLHFIPSELQKNIRESGWRQRPLSPSEMRRMDKLSKNSRFSLKRRLTFMLLTVAFALTVVMGITSMHLYFKNAKQEKTEIAESAVRFAASVVDPAKIDDYIRYGEAAEGYKETEELLYRIRENAKGVKYLYVVQIREDGCYVAFDLDTEDTPSYHHGDKIEFEKAFEDSLPALFAGEEIEPIESNDITGWVLTVYYPIRNTSGKYTAYVGADVSLSYMAVYMGDFLLRVVMILAGFFIMVLAYALWISGVFMVYPINTIVTGVERFIHAGNDQQSLDEAVRVLRGIDVHTGDEVERLYRAVCDMAVNQTEQLRSIRRFSENTAKMQDGLIITMADLVENRDSDTGAHIQKTAAYVKIIVEGLKRKGYYAEKITPKFMSDVVRSAPLHDVGKINIPDSVLNKPGKLTDEEYEIIKTHTVHGKHIMEKAISTVEGENYLKEARNMAAYHHERWDGKGYPEGLHGEVIPLAARIMAVADVFDALASPRVYKPAFPMEKALKIIQEGAGTQFDPKCVEVFMESLPEVKEVLNKYTENV